MQEWLKIHTCHVIVATVWANQSAHRQGMNLWSCPAIQALGLEWHRRRTWMITWWVYSHVERLSHLPDRGGTTRDEREREKEKAWYPVHVWYMRWHSGPWPISTSRDRVEVKLNTTAWRYKRKKPLGVVFGDVEDSASEFQVGSFWVSGWYARGLCWFRPESGPRPKAAGRSRAWINKALERTNLKLHLAWDETLPCLSWNFTLIDMKLQNETSAGAHGGGTSACEFLPLLCNECHKHDKGLENLGRQALGVSSWCISSSIYAD